MTKRLLALVVPPDMGVSPLFINHGWGTTGDMEAADLVVLTGGSDIGPELYGQHRHGSTYAAPGRDEREIRAIKAARELGKPMAGICRGAQLLNALNGGSMWQDVDKHVVRGHICTDVRTKKEFFMTSTHHQMMIPGPDAELVAIAAETSYKKKMSDLVKSPKEIIDKKREDDVEVLYYPKDKAFCIQGHPEYFIEGSDGVFFDYIEEFFHMRAA